MCLTRTPNWKILNGIANLICRQELRAVPAAPSHSPGTLSPDVVSTVVTPGSLWVGGQVSEAPPPP